MLLRKPGQSLNPRFFAWPLELGLGTHNPRFVAWPLELGLGTHNPRFVVWPLELGLGTHNPRFVAWPLELGLGTRNPRFVVWPLEGRLHVAWPFIGRKTLTKRQKEYNDVHGFYRAHIEHLFARMWHWGIVRNIWRGSGMEYVRVLLHLQQFLIRRQVRYPPYGPWEHVPAHVWTAPTQEDNDDEDVVGDDGDVYALCCTKFDPEKMSMCDKCELQYCTYGIDTHTCDNVTFL